MIFSTNMPKVSKFRNLAVLLLPLLVGLSQGEAKEMTSYEWAGLAESEERAFATGLLEGFAYSGYWRIDRKNPSQIAVWNNLADCLQSSTDKVFLVLHNAVALGGAIDKKFAEVLWNRAVPKNRLDFWAATIVLDGIPGHHARFIPWKFKGANPVKALNW